MGNSWPEQGRDESGSAHWAEQPRRGRHVPRPHRLHERSAASASCVIQVPGKLGDTGTCAVGLVENNWPFSNNHDSIQCWSDLRSTCVVR